MTNYTKGQKVRATAEVENLTWSAPSRRVYQGDIGVYVSRTSYHVVDFPQRKSVYLEDAEIEPYVEAPKWVDVEAFDTVTFRTRDAVAGEETRTAYDTAGTPTVLGISTKSFVIDEAWELLSIEKPKPMPPTTSGSLVRLPWDSWESGWNYLLLMSNGIWESQSGQASWSSDSVRNFKHGFEVVHDAGEDA